MGARLSLWVPFPWWGISLRVLFYVSLRRVILCFVRRVFPVSVFRKKGITPQQKATIGGFGSRYPHFRKDIFWQAPSFFRCYFFLIYIFLMQAWHFIKMWYNMGLFSLQKISTFTIYTFLKMSSRIWKLTWICIVKKYYTIVNILYI